MTDAKEQASKCRRCGFGDIWTVDGKGLCLGCQLVIRQDRILELERQSIMDGVENNRLTAEIHRLRGRLSHYEPLESWP